MKLIEKFMFYSVGFAAQTGDKLTKLTQKLIEQGKISQLEGKDFLEDYEKKANEMTKKFNKQFEDFIRGTLNKSYCSKQEEIKKIEERIKLIEEKLKAKK